MPSLRIDCQRFLRQAGEIVLIMTAQYAVMRLSALLQFGPDRLAFVWPATGFATAIVLLRRTRAMTGILLGAGLDALPSMLAGEPYRVVLAISDVLIEPLLIRYLVLWTAKRYVSSSGVIQKFAFAAAAAVGCFIGAASQSWLLSFQKGLSIGSVANTWLVWWLADLIPVLVVTPLVAQFVFEQVTEWEHSRVALVVVLSVIVLWASLGHLSGQSPMWPLQLFLTALALSGSMVSGMLSDHARAAAELRRTHSWLALAQNAAGFGTFDWDISANRAVCSDHYLLLHGLPLDLQSVNSGQWLLAVHPSDRPRVSAELERSIEPRGNDTFRLDYRIVTSEGRVRSLNAQGRFIRDSAGAKCRLIGAVVDVTERRKAEDTARQSRDELEERVAFRTVAVERANRALRAEIEERRRAEESVRRQEAQLADFFENAAVGIYWMSPAGVIERANRAGLEMLAYPVDEYVGHALRDFCVDAGAWPDIAKRLQAGESLESYEISLRARDGSIRHVVFTANGLWENGQFVRARCFARDVTEAKRAAQSLEASLREKEVLLKEIHHRVKNNLQIVSSLLSLQAEEVSDPTALEKFRDSQSRIRSIALIHQRLYQSGDLAQVEFAAYLESLAHILVRSQRDSRTAPTLTVSATPAALSIEQAIPCALIVHELILNALKYAFPGESSGEIQVKFDRDETGEVALQVSDNGVGVSGDPHAKSPTSFGLSLVETLVGQLKGSLTMNGGNGANFLVRFRDRNFNPREEPVCP